jgi:sugar/nucleoside kinase (ribokinase family)
MNQSGFERSSVLRKCFGILKVLFPNMPSSAFRIHGAGHGLAEFTYPNFDSGSNLGRPGTPGLPHFNAAGPALVSLTVASQLLKSAKVPITYFGLSGDDAPASRLRHLLAQTPLDLTSFRQRSGRSPSTQVYVDALANSGNGERIFVHDPGTVICEPSLLGESFFQATFNVYAGTAQLPALHASLPELLAKGRHRGALNIVATGFYAAAEKLNPGQPWSFGIGEAYSLMDLLVANASEICHLAGLSGIEESVEALFQQGLTAAIVINGTAPVYYRSLGGIFGQACGFVPANKILVDHAQDRQANPGDIVGAGDNFLAGLLTDLMLQILANDFYPKGEIHLERELLQIGPLRLHHAIEFGVVTGGLACLQYGGLQIEKSRNERLGMVRQYFPDAAIIRRPW